MIELVDPKQWAEFEAWLHSTHEPGLWSCWKAAQAAMSVATEQPTLFDPLTQCPTCAREDIDSTVFDNTCCETTCIGWLSGPDPNRKIYNPRCSRGHQWTLIRQHGKPDEVREENNPC